MSKKNLIIFPGNFLPHTGGLETHVDEFVKYLSLDKQYKITIFTPDILNSKRYEEIHKEVKVIRYPAFAPVKNFPLPKFWHITFWNMLFNLYKEDCDIVMTRTRFFSNSTLGLVYAKFRLNKKKLIHVEHGSDFVIVESKFSTKVAYHYDMTLGKLLFRLADKNIPISKAVENFMDTHFIKDHSKKTQIIRRGVDFEIYNNKSKKILPKEFDNKIKILFLGRLFKWKGVANSIKAYKTLPKKIQEKAVFIVVGDGEDYSRLQKSAGEYLNNGIYLLGKKSFSDSIQILKEADIYLHSAYPGGGLSNSLLQAMQTNCAIIASPHEGANEVIVNNKNGLLLNSNSSIEIRDALSNLIENVELRELYSKQAKLDIKKDFDWQKVVIEYKKIFDEVMK